MLPTPMASSRTSKISRVSRSKRPADATYVYCVTKGTRAPKLTRGPKGLVGTGAPRLLDVGDGYHVVVASAPLALYAGEKIDERLRDIDWVGERATEHEAVVEHVLASSTVVPMKLFTLFDSDDRARAHVEKLKKSLDRVVARIEGCDEWGLRVLFDETEAARVIAANARTARPTSGTGFLERKKTLGDAQRKLTTRAAGQADELYALAAEVARRATRRSAPSGELAARVMLDAVFLVPRTEVRRLQRAVGPIAERLAAEGFHVTLSGPWPAYSFIGAR